ncbi:sensor histidine kinase [Amphibacillus xylanus]|uniref:Signal transduction histidine-protein kinase/phosphatase DegS n=1 Tax=Amphibacillus xylanus (strain ATCC 51415 / DSM 6626 / JCM 7361 / LMG 17667 / NBRC 15112 / Ep01) TaxID=698758 RepID=K0J7V6_AMPXN|nr:sensor histidine kinase [Amphibacillus xylanus]BAM48033.1 two-component system sensor histidine kinase DegS [Amphibacillus xylanus NBRC 15112]
MKQLNEKSFDKIIDGMLEVVDKSKDEIYQLTESSREEHKLLSDEIEQTRKAIEYLIVEGDELERKERLYRNRLAQVSKNFNIYSEEQIKEVYETAHEIQTKLKMVREREITLRQKRDFIERRLKSLEQMIEKGTALVSKVSVISNYLNNDFKQISDLIDNANQKQSFGLKIIEAQEEERKRISREIHDGPAQMLANILLRADLVERTFRERSGEEALVEMKNMRLMVRDSLQEVRRIIYDLRPMALDDLGLIPTIRKYLANVEDYHQINISLSEQGIQGRFDSKYEVALFRLIQESIQNAVKHGAPKNIHVNFRIEKNQIFLLIRDDGIGFDLESKKENSFGLIGMRERVEMLDGEFSIKSQIGQGTTVYVKIPLKD